MGVMIALTPVEFPGPLQIVVSRPGLWTELHLTLRMLDSMGLKGYG